MAASAPVYLDDNGNPINPPPGYTLEHPQASAAARSAVTPPPGYSIEGGPVYLDDNGNLIPRSSQRTATAWDEHGNPVSWSGASASGSPTAWDEYGNPVNGRPTISPRTDSGSGSFDAAASAAGAASPMPGLTMPLAKALIKAHDAIRDAANLTQAGRDQHPVQAKLGDIADSIEGFLLGGSRGDNNIGTGQYGMATNPVTALITPGSSGAPAVTEIPDAIRSGYQAAKTALGAGETAEESASVAKAPGLVERITKGKAVAQQPAQAAVRGAVGATGDEPILAGNQTVVDKPLSVLRQQESAAYQKMDDAAGFDVKELRKQVSNDQYQLNQLGTTDSDIATAHELTRSIADAQDRINEAEDSMKAAGVDPKAADVLHQQRMAGQDFKKVLVQNTNADGTVNVDGLLKAGKNLRFNKYGDRLAQFMGKDGADEFMSNLQDASDLGAHALKTQAIAKMVGLYVGLPVAGAVGVYGARALTSKPDKSSD